MCVLGAAVETDRVVVTVTAAVVGWLTYCNVTRESLFIVNYQNVLSNTCSFVAKRLSFRRRLLEIAWMHHDQQQLFTCMIDV